MKTKVIKRDSEAIYDTSKFYAVINECDEIEIWKKNYSWVSYKQNLNRFATYENSDLCIIKTAEGEYYEVIGR